LIAGERERGRLTEAVPYVVGIGSQQAIRHATALTGV